jgi:peptidoglycan/LPS O-acetylase OafA/YrhL
VAFTYGCAGASYRFIERPFLLLKSRFRRVD